MSKLQNEVKKIRSTRNKVTEKTFELPITEFLLECYKNCTPSKYGEVFPKKIVIDTNNKVREISSTLDRGDIHINYKVFFEAKISYTNKNGKYSITNIRPWQELNYYILCFVNLEGDCKPEFYCVPNKVVVDNPNIHLTGMNNSSKINSHNTYVGMRVSISQPQISWLFKKHNVLGGTTYKHLTHFINLTYNKFKTPKND